MTHWTAVGTDTVGFMGHSPTGRTATVTGITIHRLAGGLLVEHWDEWDLAGLLQLGIAGPAGADGPGA
ncbi:ester cyclase [Frankia sp. CNm7]|uniref:Ester cyclase n=1 Tax=Frankia nepalensis TaxID=1836974 RepID=A0A937R5K7_9ACTN|nr:ester cyclase [Frankia nepalensis]MBL7508334.1 ester cyclase [Frankia nepalensis]MBL7524562.1 ester cyclase [Frankia nepalensis]MBL7626163.1 ester cyclase [Frankia nepalensis]